MSEKVRLCYVVEEFREEGVQISKLTTTSLWLACADFLIKVRSGKRQGFSCKILPTTKTRDANSQVMFVNSFLLDNSRVAKEINITTKQCVDAENRFDKSKTNDYYLSDSYIQAMKGLVRHIKIFKDGDTKGLLALVSFSCIDDSHILWERYSPNSMSDSLKHDEIREKKANF